MKLLFVDASKSFQQLIASMFSGTDVQIGFAGSVDEARAKADESWHFVCLSLHLPDGSGLDLTRELRQLPTCRNAPFILFTSDSSELVAQEAAASGVTEIFLKKNVGELVNFVSRYTARVKRVSGRVLYVEDSAAQALVVQAMLTSMGLSVEWCGTFDEAWAAFRSREYDLVLTDVVLADNSSGAKLVGAIRSLSDERGDVPIIAVTAYDQTARRIDLFHLGVNDYVAKPIVEEELASRVRNHIERMQAERLVQRQRKRGFDETLVHLSRVISAGDGDLLDVLNEICRKAGSALGVASASVWEFCPVAMHLHCLVRHAVDGFCQQLDMADLKLEDFPGYFSALLSEPIIVASDARSHPATIEFNEVYSRPLGIDSMLDIPLGPPEQRLGVLCFEHVGGRRYWSSEEESFTAAVGELATLAFEMNERGLLGRRSSLASEVLDGAVDPVAICDAQHRMVMVNRAMAAFCGTTAQQMIGHVFPPFDSSGQAHPLFAEAVRTLGQLGRWQGEFPDWRTGAQPSGVSIRLLAASSEQAGAAHYLAWLTPVSG